MNTIGGLFLIAGSALILLAAVGVARFDDVYARMHAGAKAPALGVLTIGIGVALSIRTSDAVITAILVVVLQLIAGPVGAHILGRAVYRQVQPPLSGPDELADAERPAGDIRDT